MKYLFNINFVIDLSKKFMKIFLLIKFITGINKNILKNYFLNLKIKIVN